MDKFIWLHGLPFSAGPEAGAVSLWIVLIPLLSYPGYLLLMALVLAACGVSRQDIAKWALRQADRQRVSDLVRAARRSDADRTDR
jgi:hypothetical protein